MVAEIGSCEVISEISDIQVNAVYACAAFVGTTVAICGLARGVKILSGGVKCLAAASLAGSLIIGGMVVTNVRIAGAKTNDTQQVGGDLSSTNDVGQVEGGTNTVGQTGGEGMNGIPGGTRFYASGFGGVRPRGSAALSKNFVTDEDISNQWRLVSVSSNVLATATFTMPPHAAVWESAQACGRGWGAWHIPIGGWNFTYGDEGWTNGFAWVEGCFRSKFRSRANEIRLLSERLALCPAAHWSRYNLAASRAWCATNDVDGLIVTFENAAIGDDPTKIASAQMELFPRTGEVVLRYDLANVGDATYTAGLVVNGTNNFVEVGAGTREVVFQRVHPFDWDMDGLPNSIDDNPREPSPNTGYNQTDAWAMLAFPSNATDIASVGYAAWVAARASEPNRHLIGLQVSSPENVWPICLTFGDKQMMCDGSEMLYFAIDDGARYSFALSGGALSAVDFDGTEMLDGLPVEWYGPWEYQSWPGMVTLHIDSARSGWIGRTAEVEVETDVTHIFSDGSGTVTAVVTNCHEDAFVGCTWLGGEGISFSDSHSLTTTINWNSTNAVACATNSVMLVTTYEGGYAITNSYGFTVGGLSEPQIEFSVSCPEVMFLNDDPIVTNYLERVYRVSLNLRAPEGVSGTAVVSCSGETGSQLFLDEGRTMPFGPGRLALGVPEGGGYASDFTCTTNVYLVSPHVGNGAIQATLSLSNGGGTHEQTKSYRVIEPLRRLVTTEEYDGRIVNPSRLVWGTNAVLKVGVGEGSPFDATNVVWSVVSNSPGRVVPIDGWHAVVEPTAPSGEVVVEARFNDDPIQPRFVLPIVQPREIPVRAFVVNPPPTDDGGAINVRFRPWSDAEVLEWLRLVNKIYFQVGISFELNHPVETVGTANDWIIPQHDIRTNVAGKVEWVPGNSRQLLDLVNHYQANDSVELYFVGDLTNGNAVAVWTPLGIVVGRNANPNSLAHELGHALKLLDCRFFKPSVSDPNYFVSIVPRSKLVDRMDFKPISGDWGGETGRGFYGKTDTFIGIQMKLLMFGGKVPGKCDIPDCQMRGADSFYREGFPPIGASDITNDAERIKSK